VLVFQ